MLAHLALSLTLLRHTTLAVNSYRELPWYGNEQSQVQLQSAELEVQLRTACPKYQDYSVHPQYVSCFRLCSLELKIEKRLIKITNSPPFSDGPMSLPFQRPARVCRTFESDAVEEVIEDMKSRMVDKDLARIFENAFPNTLDTTVAWHVDADSNRRRLRHPRDSSSSRWEGAQSFIVTGDINAEWLRDSTNQLAGYQKLMKRDKKLEQLILGAINTQAEFVIASPYCNAFQPPPPSKLEPSCIWQDIVNPVYENSTVFECKYELDSLAAFLDLSNQFHENSGSTAFLTDRWYMALESLMEVLEQQTKPTFDPQTGAFKRNPYTFRRNTDTGTETLNLAGAGNPLGSGTGLIRSAFRPSDDASIFGYLIPANAMMAVQLKKTAKLLDSVGKSRTASMIRRRGEDLEAAVWEHGIVDHKRYGRVFAYEVDGYGSTLLMDDANLPSLLALPRLGFLDVDDEVYQNTRRMVLERQGNPYYLTGSEFEGIGGPHVGVSNAWPMSVLVRALTSSDDGEIKNALEAVKKVSPLGLIHESVHVNNQKSYTSTYFLFHVTFGLNCCFSRGGL